MCLNFKTATYVYTTSYKKLQKITMDLYKTALHTIEDTKQ